MNIVYMFCDDISKKEYLGVKKKIEGQINGMKSNGYNVHYITCNKNNIVYYDQNGCKEILCTYRNGFEKKIKFYGKTILKKIKNQNIDAVYIRYILSEPLFLNFVRNLSYMKKNIFLEIPTFPYDLELSRSKLAIDKYFRKYLKKYIDKIIISSCKKEEIFGVPSLYIDNGINVENIKYNIRSFDLDKKEIKLVGVSSIRKCIGYDRLIEGLRRYYEINRIPDFDIKLTIVGDGEELNNLKKMVKQYKLEDKVIFTGFKSGTELDSIYEESDIAIGSLADHRLNVSTKSPLKSREYCARGIPFMSSVYDIGFSKNQDFILYISSNDEPVDIKNIIAFYQKMNNIYNLSSFMRNYALENFDWKQKYKSFHQYIENDRL